MNEETKICPKCNGKMEKGIILDSTQFSSTKARWAKSVGIQLFGVGVKNAKTIISYRCENCGYLENYAK